MATAHGAGLMLAPALIPLCAGNPVLGRETLLLSVAAVAVHTLAALTVTGVVALLVYVGSASQSCGTAGSTSICYGRARWLQRVSC